MEKRDRHEGGGKEKPPELRHRQQIDRRKRSDGDRCRGALSPKGANPLEQRERRERLLAVRRLSSATPASPPLMLLQRTGSGARIVPPSATCLTPRCRHPRPARGYPG